MKRSVALLLVMTCCVSKQELLDASLSYEGLLVAESIAANNEYFDLISLTADTLLENGSFNGIFVWKDGEVVFGDYNGDGFDMLNFPAFNGIENKVRSELIFYHETDRAGYLLMKGAEYGCCVPTMTVLKVDSSGVRKIFEEGFHIKKVQSLTNGDLQFYGIKSNAEPVNIHESSDTLTSAYNPTIVLSLANDFKMDSSATKLCNENEYVFAGYSYREDIKVVYSMEKSFRPYIYEAKETPLKDDCVFDNDYRKLTTEWLKELGIESFTWDDKNKRAVIADDGGTIFASQGGCEHFGILLERHFEFDIHPPEDFDYWLTESLRLTEKYGLEFYSKEIRAGNIQGIKERNGSLWYEVGDDDPADNLYYNGIEIRSENNSKIISISQYYN